MIATPANIPDLLIIEPQVFGDERSFFFECFSRRKLAELTGRDVGFAHGFAVLSETAEFLYKTTDYRHPEHERCIRPDDPALTIGWRLPVAPSLSAKDAQGKTLDEAELFA